MAAIRITVDGVLVHATTVWVASTARHCARDILGSTWNPRSPDARDVALDGRRVMEVRLTGT